MAGRKRGRPKKMSSTNPERKPKKTQSALDLLHAQTVSRAASPSPQGELPQERPHAVPCHGGPCPLDTAPVLLPQPAGLGPEGVVWCQRPRPP